jgi:hypothetical protein
MNFGHVVTTIGNSRLGDVQSLLGASPDDERLSLLGHEIEKSEGQ